MPYRSEKIKIEGTKFDRRVKLTDEDREEIKRLSYLPGFSQRQVAREYGVSRRLIDFIVNPEKNRENLIQRKERGGWKQYYHKEQNSSATRSTRAYKQQLYNEGKIVLEEHE